MIRSFHEGELSEPRKAGRKLAEKALSHGEPSEVFLLSSHPRRDEIAKGAGELLVDIKLSDCEHFDGAVLVAKFESMPEDTRIITHFSVTPEELSIFRLLGELGPSTVSAIKNECSLSNSKLYGILDSLVKKKFVICKPFRPMEFTAKPLAKALRDRSDQLAEEASGRKKTREHLLKGG